MNKFYSKPDSITSIPMNEVSTAESLTVPPCYESTLKVMNFPANDKFFHKIRISFSIFRLPYHKEIRIFAKRHFL